MKIIQLGVLPRIGSVQLEVPIDYRVWDVLANQDALLLMIRHESNETIMQDFEIRLGDHTMPEDFHYCGSAYIQGRGVFSIYEDEQFSNDFTANE